ncbi:MAG: ATP-binding protein [Haliscomenobacter sp.]
MRFKDIIGQQATKNRLRHMVDEGRVPHATLLVAPTGSGGLALALALASYLLCTNRQQGDACGACTHCRKSLKYIHPDLHFSFPVTGAGATSDQFLQEWRKALDRNPYMDANTWLHEIGSDNKQGNINKDECNAILHKISFKPFEADIRILLMWLPEYLGNEGNRLLKLIEEPPDDTFFILVAENAGLILNTILSRCQLSKVPALTDAEIVQAIQHRFPELGDKAPALAYMANGNFNEALLLAEQKENLEAGALVDWLRKVYKPQGRDLVKWSEKAASWGRDSQKHFFQYGLFFLREMLLLKLGTPMPPRLAEPELGSAKVLGNLLSTEQIEQLARLWSDCILWIERNANPKILFLDTSVQMTHIFRKRTQ